MKLLIAGSPCWGEGWGQYIREGKAGIEQGKINSENYTLSYSMDTIVPIVWEFKRWEVINRGRRKHMKSSIYQTQLLALSVLICFCVAGCAQEYEGKTSYSSSNCKETIQLEGDKYPFYPVLLRSSFFPVFICWKGENLKFCSYAEVSSTGECKRLYEYERSIRKNRH
jgi:hypothetical protein